MAVTIRLGENTALAVSAAAAAAASADAAATTAAAFTFAVEVFQSLSTGIEEGALYAAFSQPYASAATRTVGRIVSGTGSIDLTILQDGAPIYGPETITTAEFEDLAPAFSFAAGGDVNVLIENVTGTPTAFFFKAEVMPG